MPPASRASSSTPSTSRSASAATVDDAVDYLAEGGPGREILETIPAGAAREAAIADVGAALSDHMDDAGVQLGGADLDHHRPSLTPSRARLQVSAEPGADRERTHGTGVGLHRSGGACHLLGPGAGVHERRRCRQLRDAAPSRRRRTAAVAPAACRSQRRARTGCTSTSTSPTSPRKLTGCCRWARRGVRAGPGRGARHALVPHGRSRGQRVLCLRRRHMLTLFK